MSVALGATRKQIETQAMNELFGEGWALHCVQVPSDDDFPFEIRHFDTHGLQILNSNETRVPLLTPTGILVYVCLTYARCEICGFLYYRLDGIFDEMGVALNER